MNRERVELVERLTRRLTHFTVALDDGKLSAQSAAEIADSVADAALGVARSVQPREVQKPMEVPYDLPESERRVGLS